MTTPELTKALVKARIACNAVVHKAGKNQAQNYSYVGHEQVLVSGAREALLAHGLVLVETAVMFAGEMKYATRNGEQLCWRWRGEFVLLHDSGEFQRFEFEATTGPNDKAAFVASTALDRTAMLRICQLAGGAKEDPEHDSNERYDDAVKRPKSVAEKLDKIAAQGGERAASPLASNESRATSTGHRDMPGAHHANGTSEYAKKSENLATGSQREKARATTGTTGTATERGGEPVPAGDLATSAVSELAQTPSSAETGGELLDAKAWRARYEAVVAEALDAGAPFAGEDDMSLPVPKWDAPTFAPGSRNAGKKYSDPKVIGVLRTIANRKDFADAELVKRLHALYWVSRHEINKELEASNG